MLTVPLTSQPRHNTGISSCYLARGLVALHTPKFSWVNRARAPAALESSAKVTPKNGGRYGSMLAWDTTASNAAANAGTDGLANTGQITVLAVGANNTTSRGDFVTRWHTGTSGGAARNQFNLLSGITASKPQFFISSGSSINSSSESSINIEAGRAYVLVGSFATYGWCKVYVNGVLGAGQIVPLSLSATCTEPLLIGNNTSYDGDLNGWVGLVALWARQLSDAEVADVSENPWRLFAPRRLWRPGATVAAATYTLTQATYVPGSLTSSSVTPRIVRTKA